MAGSRYPADDARQPVVRMAVQSGTFVGLGLEVLSKLLRPSVVGGRLRQALVMGLITP